MVKRIRSGFGLGDNLYLQSVVRHLVGQGVKLDVCTPYPELFQHDVEFSEFSRHNIAILAHYTRGKKDRNTTQWEDVCLSAKVSTKIPLQLDWKIQNDVLVERVLKQSEGRNIIAVLLPRPPMGRSDNFGAEILPDCGVIAHLIKPYYTVQLGKGTPLYDLDVSVDYANQTSVTDMLDIASICDGFIGYPSFFVPLAESLNKPGLFVWSRQGLESAQWFIRSITPQKLLHKTNHFVVDDYQEELIDSVAEEFMNVLDQRGSCEALQG